MPHNKGLRYHAEAQQTYKPFTRARPLHGELPKNKHLTKTARKLTKHKHKRYVCVNANREASDNSTCQVHTLWLPFFTHTHTHQGRCLVTLSGALQLVHSSSLSQGKREHSLQNVQTPTSSLQSVSETRKRSTKTKNHCMVQTSRVLWHSSSNKTTKRILSPLDLARKAKQP